MFTAHAVEKEESESYGKTYWLPIGVSPACALEQIVKEILDWHRERLGLHDACGAEWWTLWMDGEDDDVGWHWDADYEARERGEVKHPFLGTVTYLDTGSAAPTVIIDDCREQPIMAGAGSVIYSAHLSLPVPGKHICFDGTLLHGAPVELRDMFGYSPPSAGGKRRSARSTLLANIWCSHQPRGGCCKAESSNRCVSIRARIPTTFLLLRGSSRPGCFCSRNVMVVRRVRCPLSCFSSSLISIKRC